MAVSITLGGSFKGFRGVWGNGWQVEDPHHSCMAVSTNLGCFCGCP